MAERFQGDYENIDEVASLQDEHVKDQEREKSVHELLDKIKTLQDGESIALNYESEGNLDDEGLNLIYKKLGLDMNYVRSEIDRFLSDVKNQPERSSGKTEFTGQNDPVNGRPIVDFQKSERPGTIERKYEQRIIRTEMPDIYLRVNFESSARPNIIVSVINSANIETYLKRIGRADDRSKHPLASDVTAEGIYVNPPEDEKKAA